MKFISFLFYSFLFLLINVSCNSKIESKPEAELQIAVIADVHLQDVYGELSDHNYRGVKNDKNGKYALIRTMGSQLRSTRIFNENYFAFLASLDDVVNRNIKHVLLPGDFSDDGQPLHLRGLKEILDRYSKLHNISFYLITGNHDVVQPFSHDDGKVDFLGIGGKAQPILSSSTLQTSSSNETYPPIVSKDIQNLGYLEVTKLFGNYGFFPQESNLYWESPFSNYNYDNYDFQVAQQMAALENRSRLIPGNDIPLPDISYLVEPISGLWLLALDANTYLKRDLNELNSEYRNTGEGHNNLLNRKKYLIDWVEKVVKEAQLRDKTLIAFSHYPMIDFNNDASSNIDNLLIGSKMQLNRVPNEDVAQLFAQAGLRIHFGGHMHLNDTGIRTSKEGHTLINIQTPSLAAYKPAYKLLTLKENNLAEIETIVIDSVPGYDTFFELYRQEHDYLKSIGTINIWNDTILSSKSYHELMGWHLKELVRLRFLKSEWPSHFTELLLSLSGKELLMLSQLESGLPFDENSKNMLFENISFSNRWPQIETMLNQHKLTLDQFEDWSGEDLIFDIYRLRSADQLAFNDIGTSRLKQYECLTHAFLNSSAMTSVDNTLSKKMMELMILLDKFMHGAPSIHFEINLNTGEIQSLNN
ncbi:metallophosphoesterase family protein [Aestuariivivens sediminis]|uniref:metallophosphoesterase family protein n=1 Tax=Aestuariivivens sediminis TaxID=2913557 RepID=UPI001F574C8B|nr:metallophosphoesterase [Aestuariivivens sediminis]